MPNLFLLIFLYMTGSCRSRRGKKHQQVYSTSDDSERLTYRMCKKKAYLGLEDSGTGLLIHLWKKVVVPLRSQPSNVTKTLPFFPAVPSEWQDGVPGWKGENLDPCSERKLLAGFLKKAGGAILHWPTAFEFHNSVLALSRLYLGRNASYYTLI